VHLSKLLSGMARRSNALAVANLQSKPAACSRPAVTDPVLLQALLAIAFQQEKQRRRSAEAESQQRAKHLAAVLEILRTVATSEFELHEVLAFLADRARVIANAAGAAIALQQDDEIRCVASAGELAPATGVPVQPNRGISGECISSGNAVYCQDTELDPRVNAETVRESGVRSVMVAPVRSDRGVIGLVEILARQPAAFSEFEKEILEILAAVVAQAARIHAATGGPAAEAVEVSGSTEAAKEVEADAAPDSVSAGARVAVSTAEISREMAATAEAAVAAPERRESAAPVAVEGAATAEAAVAAPEPGEQAAVAEDGAEARRAVETAPTLVVTVFKNPAAFTPAASQWILGLIATVGLVVLVVGGYRLHDRFRSSQPKVTVRKQPTSPAAAEPGSAVRTEPPPPTSEVPPEAKAPMLATVLGLRHSTKKDFTTVVVDLDRPVTVRPASLHNPERLYFDLLDTRISEELTAPSKLKRFDISNTVVSRVRLAQREPTITRLVLDLNCACTYSFVVSQMPPYRLVIDIDAQKRSRNEDTNAGNGPVLQPAKLRGPDYGSSVRPRRIVIDAGHGGQDLGAVGPGGLQEKELVLDIGKRLATLLEKRLNAEIVFTRETDEFVPLAARSAIANQAAADMIISIHGNASSSPRARGVETYYFDTAGPGAQLQPGDVRVAESRKLATAVQRALAARDRAQLNRGVKRADFAVLSGTAIPAVLTEIAFLSSAADERNLQTGPGRDKVAEAIYDGIAHYLKAREHVRLR
jgi:N-acetylmuramoyl-L-alanine amidase/putative methionine-R-sulfoxide reductase with GAF domain